MNIPNIFRKSIFTNARLKADLIEQQNWNSELANYVQDLELALKSKTEEYLQACADNVEFGIQYCELETKYMDLLAEDQQLGLNAQVECHRLEQERNVAMRVAEFWKAQAEANDALTSVYKAMCDL